MVVKKPETDDDSDLVLSGFLARPVFRFEDTVGEPLVEEPGVLCELPLMDRAAEWGLSVEAVPGNHRYNGFFCESHKSIGLATKKESVFFHELAHAAHSRLCKDFKELCFDFEGIFAAMGRYISGLSVEASQLKWVFGVTQYVYVRHCDGVINNLSVDEDDFTKYRFKIYLT